MELELKILKEKVIDDEKKSGIGSLFDDEKSSFQHISLLKQKYQKMRRDYDRQIEELNKKKLAIVGDQFVLAQTAGRKREMDVKAMQLMQGDTQGALDTLRYTFENVWGTIKNVVLDIINALAAAQGELAPFGITTPLRVFQRSMSVTKSAGSS
jgi:hypothetical protein